MRLIDTARPGLKERSDRKTEIRDFKENSQYLIESIWKSPLKSDAFDTEQKIKRRASRFIYASD